MGTPSPGIDRSRTAVGPVRPIIPERRLTEAGRRHDVVKTFSHNNTPTSSKYEHGPRLLPADE